MDIEEKIKIGIVNKIQRLERVKNNIVIKSIAKYEFDSIENLNEKINKLNYTEEPLLYVIKINSDLDISYVEKAKEKCKNNDFAMFKINKNNFKEQQNNKIKYLYVGSSHNIKKRLSEHLGYDGSKKTYALHLREWFCGEIEIDIYETKDKDLQLFEDILWDTYKPLLGRQGKK